VEDSEELISSKTSRAVACQASHAGIGAVAVHTAQQQLSVLDKELKKQKVTQAQMPRKTRADKSYRSAIDVLA
jgi:hypothetical protein